MGWGVGAPCVWGGAVSAGGGKIFGVDGRAGGRVRGETDVNAHQSKRRINLDSKQASASRSRSIFLSRVPQFANSARHHRSRCQKGLRVI